MRWFLFLCGFVLLLMQEVTCPPVQPDVKPVEGDSPDDVGEDDAGFGLEYDRYLREIVMALEEDEAFRKKLEEMNMTDIKNGKIAKHLDLVSHQIRERLDEIKRQEMNRLRELAREKMKQMKGMDVLGSVAKYGGIQKMDEAYLHHVDVKNPHSFESADLEKLIKKATNDLDEIDKKRRNEFKTYEMEKEHQRREELKNLDEEHRKAREEEFERMKKRHQDHPRVHHPGSKDQLEDVWEKTDNMEAKDFDPKTFFKMHDLNGDGFLDQDEVEALFQKELDQVYDPNLPEDDMRERYEDMARMREHVFGELDQDKDRLISLDEFLNYTSSQEFQKDEGWKTVDEEQNFTDEEYQRYENMLREHEEKMRAQGLDPNMVQPGMVPLGQDPNVQHMQMPQGGPGMQQGMHQQQQQQFHQQQFQQQQHGQQQQFQQHEQQQQMRQMGQMQGHAPVGQGQMQGHAPVGQGQMHGGPMDMGVHMAGGQQGMGQPQMHGGPPGMGQPQMPGGPHGMGQPQMPGGPQGMGQPQMHGGPPGMIQGQGGQMPPGQMPQGQGGRHIPRPPPEDVDLGQDQNVETAEAAVNQGGPVLDGEGQTQGGQGEGQNNQNQHVLSRGQEPQKEVAPDGLGVPVQNDILPESQGQQVQKVAQPVDFGVSDQGQVLPDQGQGQNAEGQNIDKNVLKAKARGQPSPEKLNQNVQGGMPPVQGQVPHHQQMNAQQQGQGQDTLKFQGQGHQEQQKQQQQPLV